MAWVTADGMDVPPDVLPWARDAEERRAREEHAAALVGQAIVAVRYLDVDSPPDVSGEPPWRSPGFHSIGFGIELDTDGGATFSSTWAMDGESVGLTLRAEPLRPRWIHEAYDIVVWDVTDAPEWRPFVNETVSEVRLHWWRQTPPGEPDGCHSVSLLIGGRPLHVVLGGTESDGSLAGQDDNVAVVFDEALARAGLVGPWMPPAWPDR